MCICVSFYDENEKQHFIIMPFRNGKLLVNLGVGVKYLLENHNRLEINVYNGWDESGNLIPFDSPELKKIQFLKCRQIY